MVMITTTTTMMIQAVMYPMMMMMMTIQAVMYQEDGHLKLAVRIGDMRKGDAIGAHATGMLIRKTTGKAGHKVPVR